MFKKVIQVWCTTCKDYFDEKKVEFINIEEDLQGLDVLTFRCPECGEVHKSFRRG
jgi:predicted RNA-binding Zn-ribbon protein involved in translation (DUF1610 family)